MYQTCNNLTTLWSLKQTTRIKNLLSKRVLPQEGMIYTSFPSPPLCPKKQVRQNSRLHFACRAHDRARTTGRFLDGLTCRVCELAPCESQHGPRPVSPVARVCDAPAPGKFWEKKGVYLSEGELGNGRLKASFPVSTSLHETFF